MWFGCTSWRTASSVTVACSRSASRAIFALSAAPIVRLGFLIIASVYHDGNGPVPTSDLVPISGSTSEPRASMQLSSESCACRHHDTPLITCYTALCLGVDGTVEWPSRGTQAVHSASAPVELHLEFGTQSARDVTAATSIRS